MWDKELQKMYMQMYYKNNKKRIKEAARLWCINNPQARRNIANNYKKSHKGKVVSRRWDSNNKEKVNAKAAVQRALKRGDLVRRACVICGNPKSEGHHSNYEKPLLVVWLCRKHHLEQHKRNTPVRDTKVS